MARVKPPIASGYLRRRGGQWKYIRLLDVATLLLNAHKAGLDPDVGFEDTRETVESLTRRMNRWMAVDPNLINSALWACNILDEQGKFVHPRGIPFDQFVRDCLRERASFDKIYNQVKWRKKTDGTKQGGDPGPEGIDHDST